MTEKLNEYQGVTGRFHGVRDKYKEKWNQWKEEHPRGIREVIRDLLFGVPSSDDGPDREYDNSEYRDIFRVELMRISAAVMGIEFSYAGETAFVSPTLLQIGVPHEQMTLFWALSPIVGFFMTPLLGSLSDRCLILVPNGEDLGYMFGDLPPMNRTMVPPSLGPRSAALDKPGSNKHPWGVLFTVLGTILLDFDADACQKDHARGLSTFTIMAGLGGFMGYALGGINWDNTSLGDFFGGHVRAVFSLITIIFIVCVSATITSFKEIPLYELHQYEEFRKSTEQPVQMELQSQPNGLPMPEVGHGQPLTLGHYLRSIVVMPNSLRIVCLTNLFCWMAHVCYSLYFTDFVGESVFGGDPAAPIGSEKRINYESGVRFGCWGMAMYSLSCACYSTIIEKLIRKHGAKKVYVGGLCTYSCGMMLLCILRAPAAVLLFSWTAGWDSSGGAANEQRGIGTDVAVVSSCVFVAQLLVSFIMGLALKVTGSTAAVTAVASTLAAVAAFTATKITYLDL
ncbi:unnamed protein product [Leptidea sinapis]|uniref:Major facilitator superfamily (MFS) profile domain-containing protein n=1 Tax=Leptidea sinapis TaxID=189913 RepID=A0A5E4QDE2_9NEOP|nr:unnamed protein product [Leptidea sinapis]